MKLIRVFMNFQIFFYIFFLFILSSCSETTFLVNSAKRIGSWGEGSKYKIGNPYTINGKWYYPAIDYQYDEIGYASWYGPAFHGKKTANGEIFDQNQISAAHKTLPLPSIVKVTNLENGKVLSDIRINDRGPFARNRIIDLSKAAAKKLGFVKKGIAKVRVEILEDESRKLASRIEDTTKKVESAEITKIKKDTFSNDTALESENSRNIKKDEILSSENSILKNGPLAIQVGAFNDHRNAKSLIEKLSEFKAYIIREFVNESYFYRVRIGPIENIDLAYSIKKKLNDLGYTTVHLIKN
jgi:rare lipoprotein A